MQCVLYTPDGRLYSLDYVNDRQGCFEIMDATNHSLWSVAVTIVEPEDMQQAITQAIAALPAGGASSVAPSNPLLLTDEQGAIVSFAVAAVWIVGWSFKRFIQVLKGPEDRS